MEAGGDGSEVQDGLPEEESLLKEEDAGSSKPEDLVAMAIAPVKSEFLRPRPSRSLLADDDGVTKEKESAASIVVKEKKSNRQLKRDRQQERKLAHICSAVAKTGNAGACQYGQKCRFNHDLDAFLAQKPTDLEGICPFLDALEPCPFGLTCRFYNTHKESSNLDDVNTGKKNLEINVLNKDLQKLLWKKKVCYPKADAELEHLGLPNIDCSTRKVKSSEIVDVSSCGNPFFRACDTHDSEKPFDIVSQAETPIVMDGETRIVDDTKSNGVSRPSKRAKCPVDNEAEPTVDCNATDGFQEKEGSADLNDENGLEGSKTDSLCSSETDSSLKPQAREKKLIDFRGKLYLAPLTTVGNLPFRRVCKAYGADITCGEMAMCTNLLQGQASEWALLKRHSSEDVFGVQICGSYPDTIARTVELIERECSVDFIDINMGCPIDIVVDKGAGSCLLTKPMRMKSIIQAASATVDLPVTVKVRTGYLMGRNKIKSLISDIGSWGAAALTIHGRSRQQRYSKLADWDYIYECVREAPSSLQVLGNGDIFSHCDWSIHAMECQELSSCMVARGALVKPWIFTEIKEQRHWDITSAERFQMLKDYVNFGLLHWGSDSKGVETTRHFLLEWLSYTHRYVPVGLLEVVPQQLNWRTPSYCGRDDLETLMASDSAADWVRISEMLLGKVPQGFTFAPKHKSNAYDRPENG